MLWTLLPDDIAKAWYDYDPESYESCLMDDSDGKWFDLANGPDWLYDPEVGPFYYDQEFETIYSVDLRPSHKGDFIPTFVGND